MNKNVILKQHFGHTLTVWVHCDGEQTLNRKWEVFDVQILTALTVLRTLWWRGLKPAFICFTVEKSRLDRFWEKCFVCFSFRKPGAPPCRWCRARRRQRARKHWLNWGWIHCLTALTHAVNRTTAVRPTHQRRRQSRFLKSLNLFICTVQFKMTCYWLVLSANEFFSRRTQWNLQ